MGYGFFFFVRYSGIIEDNNTKDIKEGNILWTSWQLYEKVEVDGQVYAKVGERLYSRHAVNRMQPSLNRYRNLEDRANNIEIASYRRNEYGRSISPTYIEYVINESIPEIEEGTEMRIHTLGNVQVVLNPKGHVVTIMTYQNK